MNSTERQRLGARLRQARRDAGRSQADVAVAAGIAPNTLSAIEAGRKTWDASLQAVVDELDVDMGGGFAADVQVVMELVGEWLTAIPADKRSDARRALARFLATWPSIEDARDRRRHHGEPQPAQTDVVAPPPGLRIAAKHAPSVGAAMRAAQDDAAEQGGA